MKIEAYQPASAGKVKILLDQVDSTQVFAARLLKDSTVTHGTLILARYQTQGQGRLGRSWESNPSENFMGSLVLKHRWNPSPPPFALSQAASLAVLRLVEEFTGQTARIKWPNDILLLGKKVSGILISNQWKGQVWESSIVGMGINVNQRNFGPGLSQAISLVQVTGKPIEMNELTDKLMFFLNEYYMQLNLGSVEQLRRDYYHALFGYGQSVHLRMAETGQVHQGRIEEVATDGELLVHLDSGGRHWFDLDQISILLP